MSTIYHQSPLLIHILSIQYIYSYYFSVILFLFQHSSFSNIFYFQ